MIEILQKGMLTTIQDSGRTAYRHMGVPVSGAMDTHALALANILAGNPVGEAALEITGMGPTLAFHEAVCFALSGGDFAPTLDGRPIETNRAYLAGKGSILAMGPATTGFRAYLAVSGGLDVPLVMGSRSTCLVAGFGGLDGRALSVGDRIALRQPATWLPLLEQRTCSYPIPEQVTVRAIVGPQQDSFTKEGLKTFFSGRYTITPESNRIGYRTQGPAIEYAEGKGPNIISDGIAAGAVQVPGGQPIVLMADRQTVGGYAKIAHVISVDLPAIAQLRPGDSLHFQQTDVETAQQLLRNRARKLRNLQWELTV